MQEAERRSDDRGIDLLFDFYDDCCYVPLYHADCLCLWIDTACRCSDCQGIVHVFLFISSNGHERCLSGYKKFDFR